MKFDVKPWLAVLIFIGFMACLFLLFYSTMPEGAKDFILVAVGALIATLKDVYGYYFGSSEGSNRKTELMKPPISNEGGIARLLLLVLLLVGCCLLFGCAYNSVTISSQGNVTCNASVDKPTTVDALTNPLRGANVPVAVGPSPQSSGTQSVGEPQ